MQSEEKGTTDEEEERENYPDAKVENLRMLPL